MSCAFMFSLKKMYESENSYIKKQHDISRMFYCLSKL